MVGLQASHLENHCSKVTPEKQLGQIGIEIQGMNLNHIFYLDSLLLDDAATGFVVVVKVHRLPVSGAGVIVVIRSEETRPEIRIGRFCLSSIVFSNQWVSFLFKI